MSDRTPPTPASMSTWSAVKACATPNFRIDTIIDQEQKRISTVMEAIGVSEHPSLKRIAEHSINVLTLVTQDHKTLLEGPAVDVIADGIVIRKSVALRALIASCQKANDVIQIMPGIPQFRIHGHANSERIKDLLDIFTTSKLLDVNRVSLASDNFMKDVLTYQACLALGIHYTHTIPLLNALRAVVSSRPLSTNELDILANRFAPTNPLIKDVAHDLCHRRFKQQICDIEEFESWLNEDSKEGLRTAMAVCFKEHERRRQAITRRKCDWKKGTVLHLWGEDIDGVCAEKEDVEEERAPETMGQRDSKPSM
jgi:hypothetical protein